jgi:hypothetical protein
MQHLINTTKNDHLLKKKEEIDHLISFDSATKLFKEEKELDSEDDKEVRRKFDRSMMLSMLPT